MMPTPPAMPADSPPPDAVPLWKRIVERGLWFSAPIVIGGLVMACAEIMDNTDPTVAAHAAPPTPAEFVSPLYQDHALVGRLYDTRSGQFITPEDLARRVHMADHLLLGERHDNADHHRLQAHLTAVASREGRNPAVVVEMITLAESPELDQHLQDNPGDAAGLGSAVQWTERGWPDYRLYQPIFEVALSAEMPLRAGNLPVGVVRAVARQGLDAMPDQAQIRLGLTKPVPRDHMNALFDGLAASHCHMLPDHHLPTMAMAQRARDGFMARAMTDARQTEGVNGSILIAGSGHTRSDRGVPWFLRSMDPDTTILSVAFVEVHPELDQPADYGDVQTSSETGAAPSPVHDIIWFTPAVDRGDPCDMMRRHMQRQNRESDA